jgi:hypothetical protein
MVSASKQTAANQATPDHHYRMSAETIAVSAHAPTLMNSNPESELCQLICGECVRLVIIPTFFDNRVVACTLEE